MNRLFLCLLTFSIFACDNTLGPPKGVLPEKKMVSVLVDLQVAEAKVKNLRISSDSARHVFSLYELMIFDKQNVTPEKYLHSYEYYLDNHRLMSRVHQAVLDTLSARQIKAENTPEPEPVAVAETALQQDTIVTDSLELKKQTNDSIREGVKPSIKLDRQRPVLRKKKDNI